MLFDILFYSILLLIFLSIIIWSKRIIDWIMNWSYRFKVKFFREAPVFYAKVQRQAGLWIIRIFCSIGVFLCILSLYTVLENR